MKNSQVHHLLYFYLSHSQNFDCIYYTFMRSERQTHLIKVINIIRKDYLHKAINISILDRSLFLSHNRRFVIEGYNFLYHFNLDDERDIASLDNLEEFDYHGSNPRRFMNEYTKNKTEDVINELKQWFSKHNALIKKTIAKIKKNPDYYALPLTQPTTGEIKGDIGKHLSLVQSKRQTEKSPEKASPEKASPENSSPEIFSNTPSPIIKERKSIGHINHDIDHLECYFNNKNQILVMVMI